MARAPGRDQVSAIERLFRIVIFLNDRASEGADVARLARAAGYPDDASGISALRRDIRNLRHAGWGIDNTAPDGADAHYVLHAQDNRLAVVLTPAERALLTQTLDDWQVPKPPKSLGELERAAERHCVAHFSYKGRRREVHPYTVHSGPSGWVLRGRETGSETVKSFVVSRIADDVVIDRPGSAETVKIVPHRHFDPMRWEVDVPVEVTLSTRADHVDEVRRSLAGARVSDDSDPETVRMIVRVTHRAAFRSRLYTLGVRVRVLGPDEIVDEIVSELRAVAAVGE
jgi:predicted DNA-binding transcriptional regulator YafY